MDAAGSEPREPAPAGVAGLTRRSRGREPARREAQGLDHLAASGPPQPGAPGDQRMRRGERQGAAGERRAVLGQARGRAPPGTGRRRSSRPPRRRARRASGRAAWVDHAVDTLPLSSIIGEGLSSGAAASMAAQKEAPMPAPFVVRRETQIAAPPATVFAFLTDPDKIVSWMGAEAQTEPHPGGLYLVKGVGGEPAAAARGSVPGGGAGPSARLQLRLGGERGRAAGIEPHRDRPDRPRRRHPAAHDPQRPSRRRSNAPSHARGWAHYLDRLATAAARPGSGADDRSGRPPIAGPTVSDAVHDRRCSCNRAALRVSIRAFSLDALLRVRDPCSAARCRPEIRSLLFPVPRPEQGKIFPAFSHLPT